MQLRTHGAIISNAQGKKAIQVCRIKWLTYSDIHGALGLGTKIIIEPPLPTPNYGSIHKLNYIIRFPGNFCIHTLLHISYVQPIDPLLSGRDSFIRLAHLTFDPDSCRAKNIQ